MIFNSSMRNVAACVRKRHHVSLTRRHSSILSPAVNHLNAIRTVLWSHNLKIGQRGIDTRRRSITELFPTCVLHHYAFSTGFTSVHGERPSAQYARLRKESLEIEFGQALGAQSSRSFSAYYRFGPFLALYRAAIISFQVVKLSIWHLFLQDIESRAVKFRETLIRLGPFYVKLGQALSTRPDILPSVYCHELAKLQDQIPPYPTDIAMKSIESQLGVPVSQIFADISPEPIAAASLGQVYKAHLHSGELVAVKVQRPGMSLSLTLDALLFNMIGGQLRRFAKARKDLMVAVNEMVRHMFEEIDYILEGHNAERFASLYGCYTGSEQGSQERRSTAVKLGKKENCVKVPKIYWNLTRKAVLTMEWIDGIKLTDADRLKKALLNRKELIDQGLYCSLRQLLEVGFFHADPHPGNLVATDDGSLAYFDFGMMGEIPRHYRVGLIQVGIMNQLYDVMYEFNFSLPPDYALVIRALGSLEGTAKALDPEFKVVESSYPFVVARLLADPHPDMRKILGELLIRNDGSIRWNRLERLITAISESADAPPGGLEGASTSNVFGWKNFDMRSVVAATEDLFHFILSQRGWRVRVFLVQDIIKAGDVFLSEKAFPFLFNEKLEVSERLEFEGHATITRVVNALRSLRQAVKLAPEVWIAMLMRLSVKPEFHQFTMDIVCALVIHSGRKIPESTWLCISRLLHKIDTNSDIN
ncbi:hypothetical protein AQUCO_02400159v1 [Aquilegia coerulea]|uniref:ABC1 atypical kinase-like domain-containing protein n=1 Tax=Aquilegia coerulea TaxID=218851 RepID=A0A2G5DBQ8_AQUCA|nr:hypothetical protein AQUCO_02400159v1 [Aquilegia coerulea]